MNSNELRKKTTSELYKLGIEKQKDISLLRLQIKAGKSSDIARKNILKKEVARIKTLIAEKKVLEQNEKA